MLLGMSSIIAEITMVQKNTRIDSPLLGLCQQNIIGAIKKTTRRRTHFFGG